MKKTITKVIKGEATIAASAHMGDCKESHSAVHKDIEISETFPSNTKQIYGEELENSMSHSCHKGQKRK